MTFVESGLWLWASSHQIDLHVTGFGGVYKSSI